MRNQNNKVMDIDERPKGREGIKEMLDRMYDIDNSPNLKPEEKTDKETA